MIDKNYLKYIDDMIDDMVMSSPHGHVTVERYTHMLRRLHDLRDREDWRIAQIYRTWVTRFIDDL